MGVLPLVPAPRVLAERRAIVARPAHEALPVRTAHPEPPARKVLKASPAWPDHKDLKDSKAPRARSGWRVRKAFRGRRARFWCSTVAW